LLIIPIDRNLYF